MVHPNSLSRQNPTVPGPSRSLRATRGAARSCQPLATTGPDQAAVVDAWPELPEAIKAGIVAMVKAALGTRA